LGQPAILGTSIATAKVTGAASQVWAANPDLSAAQVKAILKETAIDLHTPGWDMETGAGLLNLGLAVQAGLLTQGKAYTFEDIELLSTLETLNGSTTPAERPASFFKKLWRGVKRGFNKVVGFVKRVIVPVVKTVVSVVKKVSGFIAKAVPILKKVGSFITKTLIPKFLCLPILGKIGVVLGGIALVGAAIGGAVLWFKNKNQQPAPTPTPGPTPIPQQILDLEAAWRLLTPAQQNDIGPALKNGIDPKFTPLFDGSDPHGIIPLLQTVSGLTPTQQTQLGPYFLGGADAIEISFFNGSDPGNSFVPATVKAAWNSLTAAQRNVLQPVMLNGITSPYGRPLFDGSAEGQQITNVLNVLSSTALNDTQRSLMVSFMLNPGGIPPEYEPRFT
jgi:hypothetical protein